MEQAERDALVKQGLESYFKQLGSRAGAAGKGKSKVRTAEACRKARRKRSAKRASRTRNFKLLGKCGGSAKGKSKARTSDQARQAALAGVAKRRTKLEDAAEIRTAIILQQLKYEQREKAKEFQETWFRAK